MFDTTLLYVRRWFHLLGVDSRALLSDALLIRHLPKWRYYTDNERNPLEDDQPKLPFEAQAFVKSVLRDHFVIYEFGSGGSTVYYAKRAKHLISVEHDDYWHGKVTQYLSEQGITNCKCALIPPEQSHSAGDATDPKLYLSGFDGYEGLTFEKYATSIDSYADGSFDLVVVDGRARPSCILHARPKVKKGGYLVLDDSERQRYQCAKALLSAWEKRVFYGPGPYARIFWEATIWRKPAE